MIVYDAYKKNARIWIHEQKMLRPILDLDPDSVRQYLMRGFCVREFVDSEYWDAKEGAE